MDNAETPLRVVLADDHHFFREGLRGMLEATGVRVVGEAKDVPEAVALAAELKPDLVVIDPAMAETTGGEALSQIAAIGPQIRTIALSSSAEEADVLDALEAGAGAYILKDSQPEDLIEGIRHRVDSQVVLSRIVARALLRRASPARDVSKSNRQRLELAELTTREREVLRLLVTGADNVAIGLELSISRHTVKQHVTNIFEKLGVHSRVEAAVYAVRSGLA